MTIPMPPRATAAADPVCADCGHPKSCHRLGWGPCLIAASAANGGATVAGRCGCRSFVPPEPEPTP